jgi:hypothetical protein
MAQNWMMPWLNLWPGAQPSIDAPLSGDVSQWFRLFSPTIVNGEGDPALEREIVEDVATYGKQIGEITDVVLALAAQSKLPETQALAELKTIAVAVAAKKAEYRKNALEHARKAMDDLREHDPEGYALLLAGLTARKNDRAA